MTDKKRKEIFPLFDKEYERNLPRELRSMITRYCNGWNDWKKYYVNFQLLTIKTHAFENAGSISADQAEYIFDTYINGRKEVATN